jgi:UDP-N-acetyl-2-amino-2-deoxyglucuronate dehydrogenase
MNPVRFALLGYGHIGRRHALHIRQHPDAELVAVCDTDPSKLSTPELAALPTFSDPETMLRSVKADVVNICTPNYLHHPHALMALQQGFHAVVEKPMALSTSECSDMIEAAEKSERTIFVVKQNRYNEPVQQVKQLLDEGVLGEVYLVQVNCFWNRNEAYYRQSAWRGGKKTDGGCLFTQFSHFVDILYYLFGEVADIQGKVSHRAHPYTEVEDNGSFVMKTPKGALVNLNFSTCSYEKNMEGAITVLAEHGTVKIGGQYLNTLEYQHIRDRVLPPIAIQAKANDYGLYQGSMSNHDRVIDNVVQTLRGQAVAMTNAREGREVVAMIEQMYRAAQANL